MMRLGQIVVVVFMALAMSGAVKADPDADKNKETGPWTVYQARTAFDAGDYATALRLWRQAAEQGHAAAQLDLGIQYSDGTRVVQDHAEAVKWYRKAAEQGHAEAQAILGHMYEYGTGVVQDYAEAVKWYRKAAELGNDEAQNNLGFMYERGRGVVQDYIQAHKWFNIAGAIGFEKSRKSRDSVAKKMTPAQIAEAQKLAREWMAAHGK
jgi:uncharacterized protein